MKYETKEELADKVEWEGGLVDAIEYGIRVPNLPDDVPGDVAAAWGRLEASLHDADLISDWLYS